MKRTKVNKELPGLGHFYTKIVIKSFIWAVVVAQLVKRLLPTPDVPSSNPVNIYIDRLPTVNWIEKDGKKEKVPIMAHLKKHYFVKKWPLFHLFSVFSNKQYNFYCKSM